MHDSQLTWRAVKLTSYARNATQQHCNVAEAYTAEAYIAPYISAGYFTSKIPFQLNSS